MRKYFQLTALIAVALSTSACFDTSEVPQSPAGSTSETPPVAADVVIAAEPQRNGYVRDEWSHWDDINSSGCTAREDVLAAQVVGLPQVDIYDRCRIVEGNWFSIYDGVEYAGSPSNLDMDHIVALAEAHDSGGANWSPERKQQFANDPLNLVAVTAASNRAKSDRDLGEWRPENRNAWCTTATAVLQVKTKYGLSLDPAEYDALVDMQRTCGEPHQVTIESLGDRAVSLAPVSTAEVPSTTQPATEVDGNPGDIKNCSDFGSYSEAKAWFDLYAAEFGDVANLDGDGDGEPCESLK